MRKLPKERSGRYIDFCTDFAFKKFFGTEANKKLLIHFLNSLFELKDGNQISDVTYLNTERLPDCKEDRKAVFDVYCETDLGERFIVEMQKTRQKNFKNRSLFYSTVPIQELSNRGSDWDYSLTRIYVIGVLNFIFDNKNPNKVISKVQFKDDDGEVFNDKLNFVYIELPKFHKTENELKTIMDEWLFLIKILYRLRDRPQEIQNEVFDHLFSKAEICNLSKMEFKDYSRSLKDYRDWKNSLDYAIEQERDKLLKELEKDNAKKVAKGIAKGIAKGKREGLKEGKKEGKKEGIAIGIKETQIESAKTMLNLGFDLDTIATISKLSINEIESLIGK